MNRLVIVGNGFDLAHGLKTKYSDFLYDYLIKHIKNLENNSNGISEDDLVKVEFLKFYKYVDFGKGSTKIIDLFDDLTVQQIINNEYISWKWLHNRIEFNSNSKSVKLIKIELKSELFSKLIGDGKWTDIEKAYFDELLEVFKEYKEKTNNAKKYTVYDLNNDFDFLKSKIVEYLKFVDESIDTNFNYKGVLYKSVKNPEEEYFNKYFGEVNGSENKKLNNLFFVNFNYTRLLGLSMMQVKRKNPNINVKYYPIHGSSNKSDSIIFGYGDDSNKHYQDLEDEDNEEYLKNIKAFHYPNEPHYIDLINTLNESEFDVFVIGHSLGLSDRVLLKTIFEHDNCKAIKLFHRGSKASQFSKRVALSRHFSDKIKMRSKIVDYSDEDKM